MGYFGSQQRNLPVPLSAVNRFKKLLQIATIPDSGGLVILDSKLTGDINLMNSLVEPERIQKIGAVNNFLEIEQHKICIIPGAEKSLPVQAVT